MADENELFRTIAELEAELARYKLDHPLSISAVAELVVEIEKLTGERDEARRQRDEYIEKLRVSVEEGIALRAPVSDEEWTNIQAERSKDLSCRQPSYREPFNKLIAARASQRIAP